MKIHKGLCVLLLFVALFEVNCIAAQASGAVDSATNLSSGAKIVSTKKKMSKKARLRLIAAVVLPIVAVAVLGGGFAWNRYKTRQAGPKALASGQSDSAVTAPSDQVDLARATGSGSGRADVSVWQPASSEAPVSAVGASGAATEAVKSVVVQETALFGLNCAASVTTHRQESRQVSSLRDVLGINEKDFQEREDRSETTKQCCQALGLHYEDTLCGLITLASKLYFFYENDCNAFVLSKPMRVAFSQGDLDFSKSKRVLFCHVPERLRLAAAEVVSPRAESMPKFFGHLTPD